MTTIHHADAVIKHSLGLSVKRRWSYRNHYCAGLDNGIPSRSICWMVDQGWMIPGEVINNGKSQFFHISDLAIEQFGLASHVRKQDRVQYA